MPLYQFSASARRELREVVSYIKNDNPAPAEKWLSTLHKKCTVIHVADARQDVRSALAGKSTPETVP